MVWVRYSEGPLFYLSHTFIISRRRTLVALSHHTHIHYMLERHVRTAATLKLLPIVDSLNGGMTRRSVLAFLECGLLYMPANLSQLAEYNETLQHGSMYVEFSC